MAGSRVASSLSAAGQGVLPRGSAQLERWTAQKPPARKSARCRVIDVNHHATREAMRTPEQVVQAQLDAYNAKNMDAWLATYHPAAEQFELHGAKLAAGHTELRARMEVRFREPSLHAELLSRSLVGNVVADHERITRDFPEGPGTIDMLCLYEVQHGAIVKATFASGSKVFSVAAKSAV